MKTYYVSWTYIGNYSDRPIKLKAENPEMAVANCRALYSKDFGEKATIYVYESPPVLTVEKNSTRITKEVLDMTQMTWSSV